jgi:hypothetical protein
MPAAGLTPVLVVVSLVILLAAESWFPLRRLTEPRSPHLRRNLTMAMLGFPLVGIVQAPLLAALCLWTVQHDVGLMNIHVLPPMVGDRGDGCLDGLHSVALALLCHRMPLL